MTVRLTVAQALVRFLEQQYVERDGDQNAFFAGCWGIFGHGNVAGVGQALLERAGTPPSATRGIATGWRSTPSPPPSAPDRPTS